jgi:xanthine dehydrogenase accessory factor
MNVRWHESLKAALGRGERAALVTMAGGSGSIPRETGAAMVVTTTQASGTIGGGHLELEATRIARESLASASAPAHWLVRFPLAARLGQCCGGVATVAFATFEAGAHAWLDTACACARAGTPFIVAGRLGTGARLVVTADDARGTLGDAAIDSLAVREARERLRCATAVSRATIVAAGDDTLVLHAEHRDPFVVCVFGNGHVGRALVHVLGALPADVRWIDGRDEDFPASVPSNATVAATDEPVDEIGNAPRGAYLVILTHSHALDYELVEAALARDDLAYVGLIGSKSKRAQFERRLLARGVAPEALARLTCPIGAGSLRSKEPGVIAVAVAAELLALREARADREAAPPVHTNRRAHRA